MSCYKAILSAGHLSFAPLFVPVESLFPERHNMQLFQGLIKSYDVMLTADNTFYYRFLF